MFRLQISKKVQERRKTTLTSIKYGNNGHYLPVIALSQTVVINVRINVWLFIAASSTFSWFVFEKNQNQTLPSSCKPDKNKIDDNLFNSCLKITNLNPIEDFFISSIFPQNKLRQFAPSYILNGKIQHL